MKEQFYSLLNKRKSFHRFDVESNLKITSQDLNRIEEEYLKFDTLYSDIKTKIRIIDASSTNDKKGAEYFILIYSEKKDNYLMNVGYIGEQLDLLLNSMGIGSLWYGMGKSDEPKFEGLDYVIMFAIRKVSNEELFRNVNEFKRLSLDDFWNGETFNLAEMTRFAPSAVNTQPWRVEATEDEIKVYRVKRKIVLPSVVFNYFNRIDMGIYLCFLEVSLEHNRIGFNRELFIDNSRKGNVLVAKYNLVKGE